MESALYPLPWLEWGVLRRGLGISGRGILPAHLCPCTKELFQQLFIDRSLEPRGGAGVAGRGGGEVEGPVSNLSRSCLGHLRSSVGPATPAVSLTGGWVRL